MVLASRFEAAGKPLCLYSPFACTYHALVRGKRKLKVAEIDKKINFSKMTKIVSGKKLWNYDNLEPTERKGAI